MPQRTPTFWTKQEAAARLGISVPTLLRMIRNGALSAFKLRGRWAFRPADVQQYLREHAIRPRRRAPARPLPAPPDP